MATLRSLGDLSVQVKPKRFTEQQWFSLPLEFRKRWWAETDYGKREPSQDLELEIRKHFGDQQ